MAKTPEYELARWYASEPAKRSFGRICQAVNESGGEVYMLGTEAEPWLLLQDTDSCPAQPGDVTLTIDEAKADWPAVTTAAIIYGTRFRIKGKKVIRAVLCRHPEAKHPAEKYFRTSAADSNRVADTLEALAAEVRKLGGRLARISPDLVDLWKLADRFEQAASVIERRFAEAWRGSNDYPLGRTSHA